MRRVSCYPSVIALALALALGCSGQVPAPPPAPVQPPAAFSAGGYATPPERWWLAFEDPALHDLVAAALADNLELAQAHARLRQADAELAAAGAPLLPTLDGTLGASRSRSRTETRRGGGTQTQHDGATDLSLGLAARYELDLWGGLWAAREAALFDRRATAEERAAAAITVSAQVAVTWFALLEQRGQLALLQQQRTTGERVLELVRLRFDHGLAGAADVLRQQQLCEALAGDRAQVEAAAAAGTHALAVLQGRPPAAYQAPEGDALTALPPLPSTGLPAALVARRPDVRAAQAVLAAADRRLAAAVAAQYPQLGLRLGYEGSAERLRDVLDNWLASLAAELAAPLFDAGARRAEVRRRAALRDQGLQAWGQAVLEALQEVEDALVREEAQRQLLASLDRQLELAAGALERIRDQYGEGAGSFLDVLDALRRHQELERTRLRARRELLDLRVGLYRALAGGVSLEERASEGSS